MSEPRLFPVQTPDRRAKRGAVREEVYMAAYEVYSHVYGPQEALVDFARGCRGGFCEAELIAFLYARAFPKMEWRARVDQAFAGMKL